MTRMNRETEILLRQARALAEDQRRELVQELLRTFSPGTGRAEEVREPVRRYDPHGASVGQLGISENPKSVARWSSMAELRAQLGVKMLASNPILDQREDERF